MAAKRGYTYPAPSSAQFNQQKILTDSQENGVKAIPVTDFAKSQYEIQQAESESDIVGVEIVDKKIKLKKLKGVSDFASAEELNEVEATVSGKTKVSKSGNELDVIGTDEVKWSSEEDAYVSSYKKNIFPKPSLLGKKASSSGVVDIVFDESYIQAKISAGTTYKTVTPNPIFLKKGSYTFGSKIQVIEGSATGNIGFIYISLCTKEGVKTQNNWTAIQLSSNRQENHSYASKELNEDSYVLFEMYVNMNGAVSSDLTLKWYDIEIHKESTWSGYEGKYACIKTGTSGTFEIENYSNIYASKEISIVYYESKNNIICFGDSLTEGTGSNTLKPQTESADDCSYPKVLERLLLNKVNVINGGVGGEPSWMIAARQGGESLFVLPFTLPSTTERTRVYLEGEEQNYFYNNTSGKWEYSKDNLSYNIGVGEKSLVNPCFIDGIEGTLSREVVSAGTADPTTGETVQSNTYAYYFARKEAGTSKEYKVPKQLITNAYKNLRGNVIVVWCGQNDAHSHDGAYIMQGSAVDRVRSMVRTNGNDKYIVMSLPSGNNANCAERDQSFIKEFGKNYINIRDYIVRYGVSYANSLGANITPSEDDLNKIAVGQIPSCLLSDSVHGNYWYYQIVAKAVYEKGKDLGYW